jgi:hypothetical protein
MQSSKLLSMFWRNLLTHFSTLKVAVAGFFEAHLTIYRLHDIISYEKTSDSKI